jgi:hypothetical protein
MFLFGLVLFLTSSVAFCPISSISLPVKLCFTPLFVGLANLPSSLLLRGISSRSSCRHCWLITRNMIVFVVVEIRPVKVFCCKIQPTLVFSSGFRPVLGVLR